MWLGFWVRGHNQLCQPAGQPQEGQRDSKQGLDTSCNSWERAEFQLGISTKLGKEKVPQVPETNVVMWKNTEKEGGEQTEIFVVFTEENLQLFLPPPATLCLWIQPSFLVRVFLTSLFSIATHLYPLSWVVQTPFSCFLFVCLFAYLLL